MIHENFGALAVALAEESPNWSLATLSDVSDVMRGAVPGLEVSTIKNGLDGSFRWELLEKRVREWRRLSPKNADGKGFNPILSCLADMEELPTEWLIPGYMPRGCVVSLTGDGGTAKSTIWASIVAAVSRHVIPDILNALCFKNMIDGLTNLVPEHNGIVVCLSSEDDAQRVFKRKLRESEADMANIVTLSLDDERLKEIKFGTEAMDRVMDYYRPALMLLDPIQGFVPESIHMGERNAMRSSLTNLGRYGAKYGTTSLVMVHTNKRPGASGRGRMADSSDLWDYSRSVLIAGHVPGQKGLFYLSHEKSNYSALADTILYRTNGQRIEFCGLTDKKDSDFVREAMAGSQAKRSAPAREEAKAFILDYLEGSDAVPMNVLDDAARAAGHAKETMRNAKNELREAGLIRTWGESAGKSKGVQYYAALKEVNESGI